MIDHHGDCTGMPCTCGARALAAARRNPRVESEPIQFNLTADRLGIAHPPCRWCGSTAHNDRTHDDAQF